MARACCPRAGASAGPDESASCLSDSPHVGSGRRLPPLGLPNVEHGPL